MQNKEASQLLAKGQRLASITRPKLTAKIGRKTSVALKLYAGVPARTIMQAIGHQNEETFNYYWAWMN